MSMKTIIFFIIAIVNVISYFGDDKCCKQCCEHCCEYLKIFCNKEKKKVENNGEEEEKKEDDGNKGEVKDENNENNGEEEEKEEDDGNKGEVKDENNENNGEEKEEEEEEKEKEEKDKNENNEEEGEGEDENSKEEEEEEKGEDENSKKEEAKVLVNVNWLDKKKDNGGLFLKIFNKDENKNEYKSGSIKIKLVKDYGKTKIIILGDMKEKLKTNTQKWALFKIIYKKEGNKEEETKYLYCSDIGSINGYGIFYHCQQHVSISVIACNTSNVTYMHSMFSGCTALSKLCLSNFDTKFDTSNVSTMNNMFFGCNSLQTLDLSNFNTNKVTNMKFMFSGCKALQTLDLSNFNTSKVIYMDYMFSECKALQTVTFNKNLTQGIKQQLIDLGLTEEVKEEENKITLEKKQLT